MNEKENYGYVYVLKNESMPGLLKIGITDNMEERLRALSNTSVPLPFERVYVCTVRKDKMRQIEDALHKAFAPDRVNPRREFFRISEDRVIPILSMFQIENVTDEIGKEMDEMTDPEELAALEREKAEAPKRKMPFNFYAMGIAKDEHLFWKDDERIFVTVCSERKVIYNGEIMSLTAATMKVRGLEYGVQPTPFWVYNGRLLIDIYNDRFAPVDE